MTGSKRRPTLKDVAELSGVSVISASRVMSNAPNVSQALKEKVEAIARQISYQPNKIAGSLRGKASDLIAVFVPSMSNHVFPQIVDGINEALQGSPLRVLLGMTQYEESVEEESLRNILNWNPAAIVLSGLEHTEATRQMLGSFSGPVIEVMDSDGDAYDIAVGVSMDEAGRMIARHFVDRGRRRIGYVGAWGERPKRSLKRRIAFELELEKLGVPLTSTLVIDEASSFEAGAIAVERLLVKAPNLDAVFFANDDLAMGALFYCQSNGIQVPDQLALAGFNGIEMCRWMSPRLTTVSTPRFEMGRLTGQIIRERIAGKTDERKSYKLPLELYVGDTS